MSKEKSKIVILTGAGISAESGIQTFRASDGLWHEHRIEDVATPEGFTANPKLVHTFYNGRRAQLRDPEVQPRLRDLLPIQNLFTPFIMAAVRNFVIRRSSPMRRIMH